jgi:hypothetical protein
MARQNDEKKQFIVSTFINTSYNICEKEQKKNTTPREMYEM